MNYSSLLKENNLKVTPQRLAILKVLDISGHINVDDLFKTLSKKFKALSLATVYKNINSMYAKKILLEVKTPNQKSVYELSKKEHHHIVCKECNSIIDIEIDASEIFKEAKSLSKYSLYDTSIVFNGICPKCLAS